MQLYVDWCVCVQFTGHAGDSWMSYNVWPPYICAMLVGGLQLPLVLVMSETLGGSSSLSFIVAQLFVGPLENLSPYAKKFRRWTFDNYWQVSISDTMSNAVALSL